MDKNLTELKTLCQEYPPKRKTSNLRIKYPELYSLLVEHTNFLPSKATTSQRLWHIRNNKMNIPVCNLEDCNKHTKWFASYGGYAKYCSTNCFNKSKTLRSKQNKHNELIKKYGEDYQELSTKERIKITNLKRYGVDNPFKNVDAIKSANNKKFDRDFHFQQHLSKDVIEKLNDRNWLLKKNHEEKYTCVEIASMLGVNNTTVNKAMERLGIVPNYNYSESFFEKHVVRFLESLNVRTITNDRKIIAPYEIDIVIPDHHLAIECCGLYWHNELHKDKYYHKRKMELCHESGFDLITIFEDDWKDRKNILKKMIKNRLHKNDDLRVFARKCKIEKIDRKTKKEFFDNTHIQGNGPSSINVALILDDEIVAAMGLLKKGDNTLVLNRFSTKYKVVGGFSKLLSYILKDNDYPRIETFADLSWSNGNMYTSNGFREDKKLNPDYYYILNNKRYHKFNFRHKNLKSALGDKYDSSKTEHENCLNNNIYRIYDCGKKKFVLETKQIAK